MKKRVESAIQRALVHWLKETYPDVMIVATLNENNRHCMDMGCTVGVTDLIFFRTREAMLYVYWLELKTKKGKISDDQRDWALTRPWSSNSKYDVAYGLAEGKRICNEWFS